MRNQITNYLANKEKDLIEDIKKLIKIRSVKEDALPDMPYGKGNAEAIACAKKMADDMGLITRNFDNYVLTVELNDKPVELGIFAHLDIVPEGTGWNSNPLEAIVKDGKIFGRGAADNKGPVVATLYALEAIKSLGIELSKNVRVILGTDEECGGSDLVYYFKKESPPPFSFSPDAAYPIYNIEKGRLGSSFGCEFKESKELPRVISIEAGEAMNVVPGEAYAIVEGIINLEDWCKSYEDKLGVSFKITKEDNKDRIEVNGTGTHACVPFFGNNALTALIELLANLPFSNSEAFDKIKSLNKLFPHGDWLGKAVGINMEDKLSEELTLSFDMLSFNVNKLEGKFDMRIPVCGTAETTAVVLDKKLSDEGIKLESTKIVEPHHTPEELPFIQTLLKSYETYTGRKGECLPMGGGTYVHGITGAVAFGASYPETDTRGHAADEFAVIDELMTSAAIFAQVIIDVCG